MPDLTDHMLSPAPNCADPQTGLDQHAGEDWVSLSVIEGRYVARVLEHTGGNKQAAARILGVDRKTLDRMIKRHHIETPHFRQRMRVSTV
jgi:DNA-binding NtrC family response regulator